MDKPIELGVNIDHVATLRQARFTPYPDLLSAALTVEEAGASAVTIHLREDRRHIQDDDVTTIRKHCHTRLNLEMAATDEMIEFARRVKPNICCIVPEKREELTTEGGLDIVNHFERIQHASMVLNRKKAISVSLFIEPNIEHIKRVLDTDAPIIELHTGRYANASGTEKEEEFSRIQEAAEFAAKHGLQVNAGHGLDYNNTSRIAALPMITELNIGHSIVSRAVFVGLRQAVLEMRVLLNNARRKKKKADATTNTEQNLENTAATM